MCTTPLFDSDTSRVNEIYSQRLKARINSHCAQSIPWLLIARTGQFRRNFCMEATGTQRQSVGFPGARLLITWRRMTELMHQQRWYWPPVISEYFSFSTRRVNRIWRCQPWSTLCEFQGCGTLVDFTSPFPAVSNRWEVILQNIPG